MSHYLENKIYNITRKEQKITMLKYKATCINGFPINLMYSDRYVFRLFNDAVSIAQVI